MSHVGYRLYQQRMGVKCWQIMGSIQNAMDPMLELQERWRRALRSNTSAEALLVCDDPWDDDWGSPVGTSICLSNPSGIWRYLFVVTRWRWSDSNALIGEFSWLSGRNRSCFMSIQENFEVVSWAQLCFDTLPWLAVVRFLNRICLDLSSVMNAKINTCLQCFLLLDIQEKKNCFHLGGFYLASSSFLYQYSNHTCRSMISPLKPPGTTGRLSHPRPYPSRCRITRWSNSEACD